MCEWGERVINDNNTVIDNRISFRNLFYIRSERERPKETKK